MHIHHNTKYQPFNSRVVHPLKKSYEVIKPMTQSTIIKPEETLSSPIRIIKNINQSMEMHQAYDNYYSKVDLTNQKDKLFKENIELKKHIRKLQDQIIDSKFKANLWEVIKQNILRHPISESMITKKHGGCDSSFLKEFLQIIFDEGDSAKKSPASGCSTFTTGSFINSTKSFKTSNIQHKSQYIDALQKELQQKTKKLITLEYQLNLLKEHNVFLQSNNKVDKGFKLDKIKILLQQKNFKIKLIQERQSKLEEVIRALKRHYESVLIRCQKNQQNIKDLQADKKREVNNMKRSLDIQFQNQKYSLNKKIQSLSTGLQNKNDVQGLNVQLLRQRQYDQEQIKRLKEKCDHLNKQLNKLIKTMNNFRMKMNGSRVLNTSQFDRISQNLDYELAQFDESSSCSGSPRRLYTRY